MEVETTFHFHHEWHLDARPADVFAALADVDRYAEWWPQVRTAERIDADSGHTAIRSLLPYTLHLVLRREVEDEQSGHLRVGVSGDLEGWCQWRIRGAGDGGDGADGTTAVFDQEAVLTPRLLARTADLTGPLLRANHAWMMRAGRGGLDRYLSGQ